MARPTKSPLFSRRTPGGVFVITDESQTTGQIFFVNSGASTAADSAGAGNNPDRPFKTIAFALTQCTASQADRIYVMPGHAEAIAAGTQLAASVAGVSIIGIGNGSNRPVITLAGTDSAINVSAANVTFKNLVIAVSIDEVVKCFNVTAPFCTIDAVDFYETAAKQLIQFLLTSALGTDLTIRNCKHYQATAAAATEIWISLIGADRSRITDNSFHLTLKNVATAAIIQSVTTAPVNLLIARNVLVMLGGTTQVSAILLAAGTSGLVCDNRIAANVTTLAGTNAIASCYGMENYIAHTVNKNGILDPVADA